MSNTKPLIGVTTSCQQGHIMWWLIRLGVTLAGGKALRLNVLNNRDFRHCDGYIISGGADIDPSCYGQENTASINIEPARDALEQAVITHALKEKKPLMGICRGAQMINITQGGTLYQNAQNFYGNFVPSESVFRKVFSRRKIRMIKKGILYELAGKSTYLSVNSIHHQAIHQVGKQLKVVALDDDDIIQAIEIKDSDGIFIVGVQWHPELMLYRTFHRSLFSTLIYSTKSMKKKP